MKHLTQTALLLLTFVFGSTAIAKDQLDNTISINFNKKGLGLVESAGLGEQQLHALEVGWYYNWNKQSFLRTDISYVPMIFSMKSIEANIQSDILLGFNEPDNSKQSNTDVKQAINAWPLIANKALRIGSPAMAGNAITGDWLPTFMQSNPKIDFISVHWYKGVKAEKFIKDMQEICNTYNKPIWITEFAPQTVSSSRDNPNKYTQSEVDDFVQKTVSWMNQSSCVERFAWHDSKVGTSALFDDYGNLTPTGKAYANAL